MRFALRSTLMAAAITAGIIAFAAPAASAAESDPYTPHTPTPPSLAGSSASALCVGDAPWINYSVTLTDPDNQSKGHTAYLLMTDGTDSVTLTLGPLVNGRISGSVLWPGASVDSSGAPTGWPGWAELNGEWVETDGNYAWTRGAITAELHVNPELTVPLSYPPASAACASPTIVRTDAPASLAITGGAVPYLALGIGVTALGAGIGVVAVRRRRSRV